MKGKVKKYSYLLGLLFLMIACKKPPKYSLIPKISFKSVEKYVIIGELSLAKQDSVVVTLAFEDGDGDLGMDANKVGTAPYIDFYDRNYHAVLYKKVKGTYQEVLDSDKDSLKYGGVFPALASEQGPIDGDLRYHILIPHSAVFLEAFDTLRFDIFIIDRALHQSNTITTDEFIYKNE